MNILDYLRWRGDIPFSAAGLNEVDNLIFSALAYLDLGGLVRDGEQMPLAALCEAYFRDGRDRREPSADRPALLRAAAESPRFCSVGVCGYVNEVDEDKQIQFSAVTFRYRAEDAYIAFRGTDRSIVGWREDFNMSFLPETPGQNAAVAYVNRSAARLPGRLTVGGHSKGGNFAVYAAAFCDPAAGARIERVFSNDGPGFRQEITNDARYLAILPKTEKIIPESSLVGILLSGKEARRVVKSSAKGIQQHNPFTWCVLGSAFEEADERTRSSIFMDNTLSRWVASLSEDDLHTMFDAIFSSLDASGVKTLADLHDNPLATYTAFFRAISRVDGRGEIAGSLQKLFGSGMDVVKESLLPGRNEK